MRGVERDAERCRDRQEREELAHAVCLGLHGGRRRREIDREEARLIRKASPQTALFLGLAPIMDLSSKPRVSRREKPKNALFVFLL